MFRRLKNSYIFRLLRLIGDLSDKANIGLVSAGVAFFAMFAVFPAIAALIALFGIFADPVLVGEQLILLQELVPDVVFQPIYSQVTRLIQADNSALGLASLLSTLVALWSARAGVAALIRGLNTVYGAPNRAGVRHVLVALTLTLTLIGVAIVAVFSVVVVPVVLNFVTLGTEIAWLIEAVRWTVTLAILVMTLGLLYRYGPNTRGDRMALLTPGAVLAVVLWAAMSVAFSVYLANFANYNEIYGSLGAVIALMMWLYLSAYVVLLGAALNVAVRRLAREDRSQGRDDQISGRSLGGPSSA